MLMRRSMPKASGTATLADRFGPAPGTPLQAQCKVSARRHDAPMSGRFKDDGIAAGASRP